MIRCLVTDRRRLGGPSTSALRHRELLRDQLRAAVTNGIDFIQIRERDLPTADLVGLVDETVAAARGSSTRVLVNDRLDVALVCDANGVHLRGDSLPTREARSIAPAGFVISRAVHTVHEAAGARDVDYLVAGTVFSSLSKPGAGRWLGLDGLRAIVEASPVPVLAIGGITADRIDEILTTGAAGIAGIGLFLPDARV